MLLNLDAGLFNSGLFFFNLASDCSEMAAFAAKKPRKNWAPIIF